MQCQYIIFPYIFIIIYRQPIVKFINICEASLQNNSLVNNFVFCKDGTHIIILLYKPMDNSL